MDCDCWSWIGMDGEYRDGGKGYEYDVFEMEGRRFHSHSNDEVNRLIINK